MKRDSKIKNSMEFYNCVIFIKETDPDVTTHREFQDNGWHFYGIGNLGDSKKTDNTRVNDPTDMAEFVVEISDNTLPNSWFQTGVYKTSSGSITYDPDAGVEMVYPITQAQWTNSNNLKRKSLYDNWDDSFEFRYDMGTKDGETISSAEIEAQQEASKQVWRDMYEFVITSSDSDFVSHFGDWFITESPLYWYLFTERYTMIDNRAKNSFWHWGKTYITEAEAQEMGDDAQYYTIDNTAAAINNGYRFDLWNYDDDSSLGINNSGELTLTYGHEDTDYKVDGEPSSGFIFNAAQNVFWRRIRKLMHSQLQNMYINRESLNCWSATSLINEFDAWQEMFPEELWRLDIERKYMRTYQAGTLRFLKEMMNGRKRYQRRQFERDQEIYIGSKYVGNTVKADQIMFRCNTPTSGVVVQPDYTLRIVPYSDMYLTVLYGNSPSPQQIRAKAGQEYEITTTLTEMDDTAILIYCASRIQALNDLSACYIHDNDFSKASKLKTLIIGSTVSGYSNSFLTTLNMGNNTLLETLDIRNCPNLVGSVNLSACPNLVNVYAEGTAITSVSFATNGKIVHAHLPSTINTLVLRNLNYLTDLNIASYNNLENLTSEYSIIDEMAILNQAPNLASVRILGIDWTLPDTTLLNRILALSSSELSGTVYISGSIRNQELYNYENAWHDLIVSYDISKLVEQYLATYVNMDGSELYAVYVDRGLTPPDPVVQGLIETPTMHETAQYTYTYSGWDDVTSVMLTSRTITALYNATVRRYNVTWYSRQGVQLSSTTVNYGDEAVYPGMASIPYSLPTNISEESAYIYNLFKGWDKSTGYIVEDTNVYAQWDRAALPQQGGKDLSEMSMAEIYGITQTRQASSFFEDKDSFEFTLGHDFDFSNVRSEVLMENTFLDGATAIDTDIKLFDENAPDFTLAIEFEFTGTNTTGSTLVSCFEEDGNEGFRLRYTSNPDIQWGDKDTQAGQTNYKNIIALRHIKGSRDLKVYSFRTNHSSGSGMNAGITTVTLTRTRDTLVDSVLTFGGIRFLSDGGHDYYGTGWIHWCKIWYADLGDHVTKQLVSWLHEPLCMEYIGADRYRMSGLTSQKANASFVANNSLSRTMYIKQNGTNTGGWKESDMRTYLNNKVYEALPYNVIAALKQVKVISSAGGGSSEVTSSDDYLYLPAIREVYTGYNNEPYISEGTLISWYTTSKSRIKFMGIPIPEDSNYYTGTTEPTTIAGNTVKRGDIWYNSNGYTYYFIYLPEEEVENHSYIANRAVSSNYNVSASDGGLWYGAYDWWTRSPYVSSSSSSMYHYMGQYGSPGGSGASGTDGVVIGFSI
jgi:hypothetical protein